MIVLAFDPGKTIGFAAVSFYSSHPDVIDSSSESDLVYWRDELPKLPKRNRANRERWVEMRLVIIESPYAGDVDRNLRYARAAMRDCIQRGESPYASHALYTQPGVLDDDNAEERATGILAGFAWAEKADARVVYTDLGMSRGMQAGIDHARSIGQTVEFRTLEGWDFG